MSPEIVSLEIMILFITTNNFKTFVKGLQPLDGYNQFNRPLPTGSSNGFPTNWDNTRSPNGYPIYCKRLNKKIFIDEQIFPFAPCIFENDNTDYVDNSDDEYSPNYIGQSYRNMNINIEKNPVTANTFNVPKDNWHKNSNPKNPIIASFNAPQNSGFLGLREEEVGNDNMDYVDNSDDRYSPNYIGQSYRNMNINIEKKPVKANNVNVFKDNWHKNSNPKNPIIASFNAPQNSGFLGLRKEEVRNDNLGSTNSLEKPGSANKFLQSSGFQVPEEVSKARNELTSLTVNSDAHLSRDKFGFANDELLKNPSRFMMQIPPFQSLDKQESSTEASDEEENSKENINDQLDRDRILSVLNAKRKYDLDNYRNLENFYSQHASPNTENDRYLKFWMKPISNYKSDGKNSSTPLNQTTPKSILKKKNYQEAKDSHPQIYHYSSSHQYEPNIRFSHMIPSSYHELQSGSFSINGYGPFNTVQDGSGLLDSKSISGMNNTSNRLTNKII